ncbi:MAG: ribbon-helix-helix protein, CopG family [Acidimicrobiia bacterium]
MDLAPYVEHLQTQLATGADAAGEEARSIVERLAAPLEAAIRLTLQDAIAVAAEEITCELAPGSVEVRLRVRELEFVVTPPPAEAPASDVADIDSGALPPPVNADEGAMSRINLRLPDHLKARIEQAAGREGLSVNSWLVRAAAAALDRADPDRRRGPWPGRGTQHYTGWVR